MARFGVIGGGAWGTALAIHAARLGHRVTLWAREPEVVHDINTVRVNRMFLDGFAMPDGLDAVSDLETAVRDADVVMLVPPSSRVRDVSMRIAPALRDEAHIVVASKGIEESSLELLSTVLAETLPGHTSRGRVSFLSGPSFAKEVAAGLPTDVMLASQPADAALAVQSLLHAPTFRVYDSDDPIGAQVGGALKNVIAVAAGVCDGLGLGNNARAAVITRGLAEITRLGVALGAQAITFMGLSGVGDLILTCTGDLSRNRQLGLHIAQGVSPSEFVASQRTVAEGYHTAAAAWRLAQKRGIDMPVTEQVYAVLHEGRNLHEALRMLMQREHKPEFRGIRG